MPRYKLSPEERAAQRERKEQLRSLMQGLDVKNFDDLRDVWKLMMGEILENGLEGELESFDEKWVENTLKSPFHGVVIGQTYTLAT